MNRYIKGRITKGEFVSELFKKRVESIGGTYEANDCLVNSLNSLTDKEFKDAKLILTPNGYVVDKLPTIKPNGGGDATVTRNTTKTRVNSSGLIEEMPANVLAPDYLNGVCPALNVEGQGTNKIIYSNSFDNAYWNKINTTVNINSIISPDGTTNASKLIANTSNLNHEIRSGTISYNGSFRPFVFAKKGEYNFLRLRNSGTGQRVWFDLNNGLVGQSDLDASGLIEDYGNGWYKCIMIDNNVNSSTSALMQIYVQTADGQTSFTGDGTSGIYIYGAQFSEGTNVERYIITSGTAVTRSADSVTVPIPAGTTEIIEKYEDGTINTITTIPASPYTVPTGKRYEYILMR